MLWKKPFLKLLFAPLKTLTAILPKHTYPQGATVAFIKFLLFKLKNLILWVFALSRFLCLLRMKDFFFKTVKLIGHFKASLLLPSKICYKG